MVGNERRLDCEVAGVEDEYEDEDINEDVDGCEVVCCCDWLRLD